MRCMCDVPLSSGECLILRGPNGRFRTEICEFDPRIERPLSLLIARQLPFRSRPNVPVPLCILVNRSRSLASRKQNITSARAFDHHGWIAAVPPYWKSRTALKLGQFLHECFGRTEVRCFEILR